MKESTRVLIALGGAVAIGTAISLSGNAQLVSAADFLSPIGSIWVNAIRMTVIPLVVSLLITGIASAADVKTIGRLGRRTIVVFGLMLIGAAIVVIAVVPALFSLLPQGGAKPPLPSGASEIAGQLAAGGPAPTFVQWLTTLIPPNPIAAAANGQMVPLIIFTFLLALAIARGTPTARTALVGFFQALGDAMLVLVRWVVLVAPIGIFALVTPLAAHAGASLAGAIGFYIVAYSLVSIGLSLLVYPVVTIFAGVPLKTFARAVLPSQLIAFSSSSSIAALPALVESAEDSLGLPKEVTGFVLPLSVSAFKFAAPSSWTVGAVFIAWFYGVPLHATELATIAFAAVFLSFAGPGVPRGAFIMLTPLFLAIGLPAEGIGILIAVDAIPDTFATVLNVTGDLVAAILVAKDSSAQPVQRVNG